MKVSVSETTSGGTVG